MKSADSVKVKLILAYVMLIKHNVSEAHLVGVCVWGGGGETVKIQTLSSYDELPSKSPRLKSFKF